MIGRIQGRLLEKNPPQILVDVHGVGYEIDVPMSSFYNLPEVGGEVTLLTHFVVREDAQLLYGFLTAREREVFRLLIRISGIGARTALSILSGMSVDMLAQAISAQDTAKLTRVPGIGKKTAERLVLELKGVVLDGEPIGDITLVPTLLGVLAAAVFGFIAIKGMLKLIRRVSMKWFALYTFLLGTFLLLDKFVFKIWMI